MTDCHDGFRKCLSRLLQGSRPLSGAFLDVRKSQVLAFTGQHNGPLLGQCLTSGLGMLTDTQQV